jgi:hypothetical protein
MVGRHSTKVSATCTNTSQAATCTYNTKSRVSPHHVVNHPHTRKRPYTSPRTTHVLSFKEDLAVASEKVLENKFQQLFNVAVERLQASGSPFSPLVLHQGDNSPCSPSSVASTTAQPCPVDYICITTPCGLHISYGRACKTKEVASGLAFLDGGLFEGKEIPHYYECV